MRVGFGPSWILSFIDLVLIMLGASALLIADKAQGPRVATAVSETFGGAKSAFQHQQFAVAQLFEENEARLSKAGQQRLLSVVEAATRYDASVHIFVSIETFDSDRLQGWELAAARSASIAYALSKGGLDKERVYPQVPSAKGISRSPKIVLEMRGIEEL